MKSVHPCFQKNNTNVKIFYLTPVPKYSYIPHLNFELILIEKEKIDDLAIRIIDCNTNILIYASSLRSNLNILLDALFTQIEKTNKMYNIVCIHKTIESKIVKTFKSIRVHNIIFSNEEMKFNYKPGYIIDFVKPIKQHIVELLYKNKILPNILNNIYREKNTFLFIHICDDIQGLYHYQIEEINSFFSKVYDDNANIYNHINYDFDVENKYITFSQQNCKYIKMFLKDMTPDILQSYIDKLMLNSSNYYKYIFILGSSIKNPNLKDFIQNVNQTSNMFIVNLTNKTQLNNTYRGNQILNWIKPKNIIYNDTWWYKYFEKINICTFDATKPLKIIHITKSEVHYYDKSLNYINIIYNKNDFSSSLHNQIRECNSNVLIYGSSIDVHNLANSLNGFLNTNKFTYKNVFIIHETLTPNIVYSHDSVYKAINFIVTTNEEIINNYEKFYYDNNFSYTYVYKLLNVSFDDLDIKNKWWYKYYNDYPINFGFNKLQNFSGKYWFNSTVNALILHPKILTVLINHFVKPYWEENREILLPKLEISKDEICPYDKFQFCMFFLIYNLFIKKSTNKKEKIEFKEAMSEKMATYLKSKNIFTTLNLQNVLIKLLNQIFKSSIYIELKTTSRSIDNDNIDLPELLIYNKGFLPGKNVEKELIYKKTSYILATCTIHLQYFDDSHVISCFFIDNEQFIYDSNNILIKCKWVDKDISGYLERLPRKVIYWNYITFIYVKKTIQTFPKQILPKMSFHNERDFSYNLIKSETKYIIINVFGLNCTFKYFNSHSVTVDSYNIPILHFCNTSTLKTVTNISKQYCNYININDKFIQYILNVAIYFMDKGFTVHLIGHSYGGSVVSRVAEIIDSRDVQKTISCTTMGSTYVPFKELQTINLEHYMYYNDIVLMMSCNRQINIKDKKLLEEKKITIIKNDKSRLENHRNYKETFITAIYKNYKKYKASI